MATITIERLFVAVDPVPVSISLQTIHSHHGSRHSSPAPPRPPQPVFEAARLKPLRRGQRTAVTVLLIAANIVQVSKQSGFSDSQLCKSRHGGFVNV